MAIYSVYSWVSDQKYRRVLDVIRFNEGGIQRDPTDIGNWYCSQNVLNQLGIQQQDCNGRTPGAQLIGTYHGVAAKWWQDKLDVRQVTKNDAAEIFYNNYYKAVGADRVPWPMDLFLTDAAVNHGVGGANKILQASGGNPRRYLDERHKYIDTLTKVTPTWKRALHNRTDSLYKYLQDSSQPKVVVAEQPPGTVGGSQPSTNVSSSVPPSVVVARSEVKPIEVPCNA